jgi:ABC-type antimicrobial peptide transport system permease subunit
VFGSIGLLLAGIGLYGAIAYQVARRTHEIGVRMALGAQVGEVKGMIFRRGMVLALFGIALGLALYLPAAGVLVNRVYGARPVGWAPLLIAPAALLLVAALASYLPARRAALLNPAEALRVQ